MRLDVPDRRPRTTEVTRGRHVPKASVAGPADVKARPGRSRSTVVALLAGAVVGTACAASFTLRLGGVTAAQTGYAAVSTAEQPASEQAEQASAAPASPPPPVPPTTKPAPPSPPPGKVWQTFVTFYSAGDNDPPGSRTIANPNKRHSQAGGAGTFADPITMAGDPRAVPTGTIVYYPALKKYFVMEDICAACVNDWGSTKRPHIDFWAGTAISDGITTCMHALTPGGMVTVELGAPAGRPVDPTPIYAGGRCIRG